MKETIYKLILVNNDGTVADIIIDHKRELMNDFKAAAERAGEYYAFERHSANKWNDTITVDGYYFEGQYIGSGYPFHNHYSYRYNGYSNFIK